jgi:hypothetical protein
VELTAAGLSGICTWFPFQWVSEASGNTITKIAAKIWKFRNYTHATQKKI